MPANLLQRFLLIKVRNVTVPVMIGVLKFRKRVVVGRSFHSNIVNLDFLMRLQIIIDNHSAATDDRHLAHLSRFKPAALNSSKAPLPKCQGHVGHVFDCRSDVSVALAIHCDRELPKNMQDDGNVVRGKVPSHIDVFLKQTQIKAP